MLTTETQEGLLVDRGHTTREELDAVDQLAKEKYFGSRSILIREALAYAFGFLITPKSISIANVCWGACKSHPISRIRPPSIRALSDEHQGVYADRREANLVR
jgi:hypothetical protein